ncbi:hypothetical protein ARMSODRAFT_1022714 [Armillaria solidipes]|uniref:Uncharacterized protein n=1 Tax=Armillaria solidipes TaxID=1076256 RepID=A0A2H3B2A8_9AGAR|nr:hypothetical protein ARMSODRAFT_1022714 [Armillaria solidipes]
MEHTTEERTNLLTPLRYKEGLLFPTAAKSETDFSPSSTTLPESHYKGQWIRLGITPAMIVGLLFGATFTAVLHHIYLFILRGRAVSSQFWIKNSYNALSTLVQWLCAGSVSVSLPQLIWWIIRRRPFTIRQLNHLFGLPSPFQILHLASSKTLWNVIPVITMAVILQAFTLVSIFAPNSLEIGAASPQNTTLSVPTIFFSKSNFSKLQWNPILSAGARRVLDHALQSETLNGWNAPVGCGIECSYTIQYTAPALRCTELSLDEVDALLPDSQSLPTIYNSTDSLSNPTAGANMSMAWRTYEADGRSKTSGAHCSLYNTTQQSVVLFVNNTRVISPAIISYDNLTKFSSNLFTSTHLPIGGNNTLVSDFSPLLTYVAIVSWLYGSLAGSIQYSPKALLAHLSSGDKELLSNNLLFSLNETAGTFTPNSENVLGALEQILVNTTVAMITSMGHTTLVNASVVQDQLVWVYHGQRLWIIYATALALTATCGGIALVCMLKNGGESDLTFWDIVRATRSSDLDAVVEGERLGDAGKDTMLQYEAVKGMDTDRNASGVFVLARPRHEGSS